MRQGESSNSASRWCKQYDEGICGQDGLGHGASVRVGFNRWSECVKDVPASQ